MNNLPPFALIKENRIEFLQKKCALCLCALFYPEIGDQMPNCSRLQCCHTFHKECLDHVVKNECPECRSPIEKRVQINQSLELAIRNEAFDDGCIDENIREQFKYEMLSIRKYPYHKIIFEKWRNEYLSNSLGGN
jgi:hypothetical protein